MQAIDAQAIANGIAILSVNDANTTWTITHNDGIFSFDLDLGNFDFGEDWVDHALETAEDILREELGTHLVVLSQDLH